MLIQESKWISSALYNQFPSVEEARNSVDEQYQTSIGKVIANSIPELIGQVGTTPTHRHHLVPQNTWVIGSVQNYNFVSKPKCKTDTTCPILWAIINNELVATEGMENASGEMSELAHKIQTIYSNKILQAFPLDSHQIFSNLSLAINPKNILNTDKTHFVETNDKEMSIHMPKEKKEPELSDKKVIPTYKSIGSIDGEGWCSADCLPSQGNHYYSHMKL